MRTVADPPGAAHEVAHAVEWGFYNVKIGHSMGVSRLKRTTGVHMTEMRSGFGPIGRRAKLYTPVETPFCTPVVVWTLAAGAIFSNSDFCFQLYCRRYILWCREAYAVCDLRR